MLRGRVQKKRKKVSTKGIYGGSQQGRKLFNEKKGVSEGGGTGSGLERERLERNGGEWPALWIRRGSESEGGGVLGEIKLVLPGQKGSAASVRKGRFNERRGKFCKKVKGIKERMENRSQEGKVNREALSRTTVK